jgi:hypothetical protein
MSYADFHRSLDDLKWAICCAFFRRQIGDYLDDIALEIEANGADPEGAAVDYLRSLRDDL